jgi:hypothetical protein
MVFKVMEQYADKEICLKTADRALSRCPAIHWDRERRDNTTFKTVSSKLSCWWIFLGYRQSGSKVNDHDDLTGCVIPLSEAQIAHLAC